jgi:hypothetical protein
MHGLMKLKGKIKKSFESGDSENTHQSLWDTTKEVLETTVLKCILRKKEVLQLMTLGITLQY